MDLNPYQSLPEDVRADCQKRMDDARTMFAEKVAQYTQLSLDDVLATEAAVYDGASAISVGLADEMVNAADAVNVMASAIRNPEKPEEICLNYLQRKLLPRKPACYGDPDLP